LWQPLPQVDKGKEDLGAIKGGKLPLRGDLIFISELARLSWFFYLQPVRGLVLLARYRVVIQEGGK
jgi:hypothetical protein